MFDRDRFNRSLGCEQSLEQDEQLRLYDQVLVQCTSKNVVAIFESAVTDQRTLNAFFQVSVLYNTCLPFMTRSGQAAIRMESPVEWDETDLALDCLNALLIDLEISAQ